MIDIVITDRNGVDVQQAVSDRLNGILRRLRRTGKLIQDGMLWTVRHHFETIYPGSTHYSPEKVTPGDKGDGSMPYGSIDIDVPGVTRAYHDMHIRPRFRRALTIPIHRESYGKRAADFADLFVVKSRNTGKAYLAKKTPGSTDLTYLFRLASSVYQRRDKRLMPSDKTIGDNVFARIKAYLGTSR